MHASRPLRRLLAAIALVLTASVAHASELSADLSARRARVMDRLAPGAMLVLWSAPPRTYSLDVEYEYRQESNLYYLTGIVQEETILVLMPGNPSRRELLFVTEPDPSKEHWYGRVLTPTEITARTGIQTVEPLRLFEPFMDAMLGGHGTDLVSDAEGARFFEALAGGQATLAMLVPAAPAGASEPATRASAYAERVHSTFPAIRTTDVTPVLSALRTVKTPYERQLLVKSLDISSDAQMIGMRTAHPGAYEYEVKAAIEGAYRGRGARSWAYPSIVGSGPNATILHYPEDDRQMRGGELLLVDAAANYEYMAGDITRTYPVNGRFTEPQKTIYEIVLEAQTEAMKVARPGSSLAAIHSKTVEVIKAGLLDLGLITDTKGDQYKMWYTHSATHYIGIDVHDVGDRNRRLEPGMSFVIEPGIYIRQSALDALPKTAENMDLIRRVQPAVNKYLDIGIRIEDSFLLEENGLRRLSAAVPRTIDEVEAFMRKK